MKKLIFLTLMITSAWLPVLAATEVKGLVTDARSGLPVAGAGIKVKETGLTTRSAKDGTFSITVLPGQTLVVEAPGYHKTSIKVAKQLVITIKLHPLPVPIEPMEEMAAKSKAPALYNRGIGLVSQAYDSEYYPPWNTEEYATIHDNIFHNPLQVPLSTFAIDVDAASYSNVRRFINNGQRPPKDAVRIEELLNYFDYDYPAPDGQEPFGIYTEVGPAPWNPPHQLVLIGLQGKKISHKDLPPANLVFLVDVSGSMAAPNKLPLLKAAFRLLANQLRPQDKVSIVVYAGAAGLVLPPTPGDEKSAILQALDNLEAGGSTAGGAGIKLAYKIARENFIEGGNNRIILATDGDFNIGASSNAAMERLVEKERQSGIFLTVLGFGMGNYKDSKMEILADKGNGNYTYIDNMREAKKVLVNELGGTLFTIAKDVKIQVEFNPARVQAYRLIGYVNRKLEAKDFNNDQKDAGELGAGHTVTALYEVVPTGIPFTSGSVDTLKYQPNPLPADRGYGNELLTVKLRYKEPDGEVSKLLQTTVKTTDRRLSKTSDNFRWAAAVAEFGMVLRDSEFKGNSNPEEILKLARSARGRDPYGYRQEFIGLVELAADLNYQ
ncbi:MAG TPA: DUF3520 domain-containing protein [Flammeovirgaceae bacterium]|nr:DUF3520 domain-containing protein [Flammeovirgaceae bacterium]